MATKVTVFLKAATPPYGALAVARLLGPSVEVGFDRTTAKDVTVSADKGELTGTNPVLRHLARAHPEKKLYGGDAVKSAQVDYWLDYVQDSFASAADYKSIAPVFDVLNTHLRLRSFVVGYSHTIADFAAWGALRSNPIFMKQIKAGKGVGTYLSRWFQNVSSIEAVQAAVADWEKVKVEAKPTKKGQDQGNFDIALKDAEMGKVVTRFPPEPSGYLHIGHVKAALMNNYFARTYKGKLIVRFDDTNPSKEKAEFEESIKEDLLLIGIKGDQITYTSDSFDIIYDYALKMITKGLAFVDDTDMETMRLERGDRVESKWRNLSVEENLLRFEEMTKGTEYGQKCALRAKIDMKSDNGTLRDPVIYRCNALPHHRTQYKWKLYPTYDFACPIVDSIEGVTHALRTNEYRDRNHQYEWFLKALDLRWVHIYDFSRLNFVYTLLSKRKLAWFVEQKLVSGWDDPRFPTIRGIRRRGMTVEALQQYILSQGASQRDLNVEWDKIWAVNKKVIDPVAPRHTAINLDKIVKVQVVGEKVNTTVKDMPKHKKNPDVGTKVTTFSGELYIEFDDAKELSVDEEITFMDWGNVIVKKINWSADKSSIDSIDITLNLDGDFKKTKKKLTWLSRAAGPVEQTPIPATLLDYDYLITKAKLEEEDDVQDFVTPNSEFKTHVIGDANLRHLKKDDIIQLERKGYYICDRSYDASSPGDSLRLIFIPDGHVASTQSKADEKAAPGTAPATKDVKKVTPAPGAKSPAPGVSAPTGKSHHASGKSHHASDDVSMYKVKPIYDGSYHIEPQPGGKMYAMKNVYGFEESAPPEAATTSTAPAPTPAPASSAKPGKEKPAKEAKAAPPAAAASGGSLISKLDIVVGKVVDVKKHPDADSLYVEQIDVGEAKPREIVSGLVKFMTEDQVKGATILVIKNMKPQAMRGIKSYGMVLCASNDDHTKVEFIVPPPGSVPGDKVFFEGHEGEPEEVLNPKKKVIETVKPDLRTRDDLVATWQGVPFQTKKGLVKAVSLKGAAIG